MTPSGSNFDRPPPDVSPYDHLVLNDQNGYPIAVSNLYLAGVEIVKGILGEWGKAFNKGVQANNYMGDIFGSLGGAPDFGRGSVNGGRKILPGGQTGEIRAWEPTRGSTRRRGRSRQ